MQIFALETNDDKLKEEIMFEDEKLVLCTGYHWFIFAAVAIPRLMLLAFIAGLAALVSYEGAGWILETAYFWIIATPALLYYIGLLILRAWIDWKYDCLLVTDSRVIVVNQSSIFSREIQKMDIENIASVKAKTQFLNLVPFGILIFDLKEGTGRSITIHYIRNTQKVSSCISECLQDFQTRNA